jgi:hypothetical protein
MMIWDQEVDQPKEVHDREVTMEQLVSWETNHSKELLLLSAVQYQFEVNHTQKLFKHVSHMLLRGL